MPPMQNTTSSVYLLWCRLCCLFQCHLTSARLSGHLQPWHQKIHNRRQLLTLQGKIVSSQSIPFSLQFHQTRSQDLHHHVCREKRGSRSSKRRRFSTPTFPLTHSSIISVIAVGAFVPSVSPISLLR